MEEEHWEYGPKVEDDFHVPMVPRSWGIFNEALTIHTTKAEFVSRATVIYDIREVDRISGSPNRGEHQ